MGKDNTIRSLVDMYEAFDCDSKAMKEYLDKRILILGHNLTEQDKIEKLYEERTAFVDNFRVCEWDAALEMIEYFEGKKNEERK
jgi:hypothetical protein